MLFGKRKQNTLTNMDKLIRDAEKVLPIKAYYTKYGPWGKNTRKINYLQGIGVIITKDNQIDIFGKPKAGQYMMFINGMHSERDGRSYLYFREHNNLTIIRNGHVDEIIEPSFDLNNIDMFHSYVNNHIGARK
jgi:hypothetical protein